MHITVAIPTYNRADELRKTLEGLTQIDQPVGHSYDILVIDNKSPDNTAQVIEEFVPRFHGLLRGVFEQNQGHSHARNRAITDSTGDVVAYLDDDVDLDPQWLIALIEAYQANDVAVVGGRARLVYPKERPAWMTTRLERLLSRVEHGDEPKEVGPGDLFGLNVSFRRDWLGRVGFFRTDLGRVGNQLFSGEEIDMLTRVHNAGGRLWYEPRASLGHRVAPERLHRRWFLKRLYTSSLGDTRATPDDTSLIWLTRYLWYCGRDFTTTIGTSLRHGPNSAKTFEHTLAIAGYLGRARGTWNKLTFPRYYPAKVNC